MDKEYYKTLTDKYFSGNITEAEISELAEWIRCDTYLSEWWKQEYEKSDINISPDLRDKMFVKIKAKVLPESANITTPISAPALVEESEKLIPKKSLLPAWTRWAAMICLPILLVFFTYYLINNSRSDAQSPVIVKADKGDKATIVLPDGTDVILNSASQLSYLTDFGKSERRVKLEGEGYFKVAHDIRRTFIVQVGELEIKVLGTVFNICAYGDDQDVTVVLLEGKIGVYTPSLSFTMKPGEKMNYNKTTRKLTTENVQPDNYVNWTKGNLYFQNESLAHIMTTLSRIYNVTIRIDSSKIAEEHFTGTIPSGGIQNALNVLMMTAPFYYEMEDSVIVLKEK